MLRSLCQPCRCISKCLLQTGVPGGTLTTSRKYENPNTHVFKRMHEINLVGASKYPLLKRRHYILNRIELRDPGYRKTMECILTKEVIGVGLAYMIVTVPKRLFRNILYPQGLAVYASPENIQIYDEKRKLFEECNVDFAVKEVLLKLSTFHLRVFMNPKALWVLNTSNVRIAFRKLGIVVQEKNIVLPQEPITTLCSFTVKLRLKNLETQIRATIYPLGEDGLPDPEITYPSLWDNTPIDPVNTVYILHPTESDLLTENTSMHVKVSEAQNNESDKEIQSILSNAQEISDSNRDKKE